MSVAVGRRAGAGAGQRLRSAHTRRAHSVVSVSASVVARQHGQQHTLAYHHQPPVTRRSAQFERELYKVWSVRVGAKSQPLPADRILTLLNDMKLYPSQSQVCEMLQCAPDCSDRSSPSQLSFGEFCYFATELKRCYHKKVPRSTQFARKLERDGKEKRKRYRKMSKSGEGERESVHEVFLGGSCNPTTWRRDTAIPLLTSLGLSYYNPQVEDWSEELVELEHQAKQTASVLFYVINGQTRNVVSMIEAAAFAGARRRLVLVINPYHPAQSIAGEPVSPTEYKELSDSLLVLRELADRQGIPVFSSIHHAIDCTAKILQASMDMQHMDDSINTSHIQMAEKRVKLGEAFNKRDSSGSGYISLADVCMAYKLMTNRKLSISELKDLVSSSSDCKETPIRVNFEEFCAIIAELKSGDNQNNNNHMSSEKWALCSKPLRRLSVNSCSVRDVFLAGDTSDYSWTDHIAIPALKRHNLSYYTVNKSGTPDLTAVDNSFVLLFVVTSQSRSQAVMTLAAHYIGLGCNVVVCLQHIPEEQVLSGEKLSKQAVNDYNRGRIYLKDLARRDNIPIFASVEESVNCVIEKCENR